MKRSNKSNNSKAHLAAATMPALKHSIDGKPFDITRSQVALWLRDQPEILQAMFEHYKDRGAIVFDPLTRTWAGSGNPPHTPPASQESARS